MWREPWVSIGASPGPKLAWDELRPSRIWGPRNPHLEPPPVWDPWVPFTSSRQGSGGSLCSAGPRAPAPHLGVPASPGNGAPSPAPAAPRAPVRGHQAPTRNGGPRPSPASTRPHLQPRAPREAAAAAAARAAPPGMAATTSSGRRGPGPPAPWRRPRPSSSAASASASPARRSRPRLRAADCARSRGRSPRPSPAPPRPSPGPARVAPRGVPAHLHPRSLELRAAQEHPGTHTGGDPLPPTMQTPGNPAG